MLNGRNVPGGSAVSLVCLSQSHGDPFEFSNAPPNDPWCDAAVAGVSSCQPPVCACLLECTQLGQRHDGACSADGLADRQVGGASAWRLV